MARVSPRRQAQPRIEVTGIRKKLDSQAEVDALARAVWAAAADAVQAKRGSSRGASYMRYMRPLEEQSATPLRVQPGAAPQDATAIQPRAQKRRTRRTSFRSKLPVEARGLMRRKRSLLQRLKDGVSAARG